MPNSNPDSTPSMEQTCPGSASDPARLFHGRRAGPGHRRSRRRRLWGTLIELDGVCRVFEGEDGVAVRALDDISLQVHGGEFVCITGPSGSGKSTLMNIIGCLDRPTTGDYRVAGTNVATIDDDGLAALRRHAFGFVFQSFNLLESLTALRNVELPAIYANAPNRWRHRRAREILGSIGLGDRIDHRAGELSGGEQQRVAIGRALMNDARVILADEPTGALDSAQGDEILNALEELAGSGKAVIVVSHDQAIAGRAHRVVELVDGRIVADTGLDGATIEDGGSPDPTSSVRAAYPISRTPWRTAIMSGMTALRVARFRTALTTTSVALGVWSVVALLSLIEGIGQDIDNALERMGANRLTIFARSLKLADAEAIVEEVANVGWVVPTMSLPLPVSRGGESTSVVIRAKSMFEPRTLMQNLPWPLDQGTYLTQRDTDEVSQVAVIVPTVSKRLFRPEEDALGQHVYIDGIPFVVKGVLARHPQLIGEGEMLWSGPTFHETRGNTIHVPFKTGTDLLFGRKNLTSIDAFVLDTSRIDETATDIKDFLFRRHGTENYVENPGSVFTSGKKLKGVHIAIFGTIGAVAILVGGMGIMAVTLASVRQRTREIGIRMAVGARRRDITAQFLVETVVATTLGGVIGALLGFAGSPLLSHLTDAPVAFAPWFVPVALGCAVAAGLLFGIVPARRASRLDPVAALSAE